VRARVSNQAQLNPDLLTLICCQPDLTPEALSAGIR